MSYETISIEGAGCLSLSAEASGDVGAMPVLLAHGGGQTRRAWKNVIGDLAEAGFRAIAIDMRGHGDSDWSPDGNYKIENFRDDLLSLGECSA